MSSNLELEIKTLIEENPVIVFSKSYCPYCKATKSTFDQEGVKHKDLELDQLDTGAAIQNTLAALTNQRTVPVIFIGGKFIGGNSDLQVLKKNSQLKQLLKDAGAA
ncbi:thioredoxin-like protein [Lipomyces japonicus]|uniref:thioredoxin-like protein n=1 Tax=Lipomyces japonicus TaxID=56871 RepID=UPI0034CFA5BF